MVEFGTDVPLDDIAVRDTRVADAIGEPLRVQILDMLAGEAMAVGDVHDELRRRGYDRTENTVRHHINELRDAGLVEVARLEEGRGGTKKFYEANTILLSYTIPEASAPLVDEMVEGVTPDVAAIVEKLDEEYADELDEITASMAPCEHCRNQRYETYVLLTVLRRAFVRAYDGR